MSLKNVSLKIIAMELNVSINTVSHALRDMDDVSETTKAKVRKKALELGYMPNHVAQKMHKDEKPLVAIVVDSLSNLYFNTYINELTELFHQNNEYDFMFLYASKLNTDVIKQCILQRVDLLITHMSFDEEVYEFAKLNAVCIIFVGSGMKEFAVDCVSIDNFMGCVLAAQRLSSFNGNNKYLYVGVDYFLSAHRYAIFKTELDTIEGDAEVRAFNYTKDDVTDMYALIKNGFRKIFFYNDMIAYAVMAKLKEKFPDLYQTFPDIRIIGFDGLSNYVFGLQEIDSVAINFTEFAQSTYRVMKLRLEKPESKIQKVILPVSLHVKKS